MTGRDDLPPLESHDPVSQRAAELFERQRFGAWGRADQAELDAWLAESILHEVAYLRVEGIVAHTGRLAAMRPFEAGVGSHTRSVFAWRRTLPLLIAASVAAIAALSYPLVLWMLQPADRAYSTDVGGHVLIKFSDGTQIELNTDTAVRYRMTTAERTVWLDRGEAWFRVAHDAKRPFTAIVGNRRITDLGTEFVVRRGAADMEVTLFNGRAALSGEGGPTAMLAPGDDAIATRASLSVTRKTAQQLTDELAWRQGMLVFRNARLADAVREFNRYNSIKLLIGDPAVADLKVNAEIRNDNSEGFLQLAQEVLDLRTVRSGSTILIYRGQDKKTK